MANQTFKYYIPYLIRDTATGAAGFGYRFTTRSSPIETQEDIEEVIRSLEIDGDFPVKSILLIDWKRVD